MGQDRPNGVRPRARPFRARRLAPLIAGVTIGQFLAGCTLEAEKPELALDTPAKYRYTRGAAQAALPALDWWRGYHSMELIALVEFAQAANFDIAIAVAQIEQADAQVRIDNAALFPLIDLNASPPTASNGRSGGSSSGSGGRVFSTSLSASYMIDFWGKNQSIVVADEESAVASRYNREVVTLTAISAVANTYFQILEAQDRRRILRENLDAATRILNLIRQQFNAGTASAISVAQQEALVGQVRASIPPVEETLHQSFAALAVLIGRAPERVDIRGGSMDNISIPRITPGLPSELLNQRPDLRQAEAQLAAANYDVRSARAAFFPSIKLTAESGFQSVALQTLFGPGAWFYTAAASLTQPVFDGGQLQGQLEKQVAVRKQLLQAYRKAVLSAFSDVEKALIAVQQTTLQEQYEREAVRASQTAFNLSEQQLREGTVNLVNLLQVEQTLFQAEDTLAQIQFSRLQATVGLFQALGGGWPPAERPDKPRTASARDPRH
jgi:NodT family efflux transporter outer membrane factor (OMF) lipoprotein